MSCRTGRCRRHFVCSDCVSRKLTDGERHHVVRTFVDGKATTTYVDGVETDFTLTGRRQPDGFLGEASPGDYWLNPHDRIVDGPCWYIRDPGGRDGALRHHNVIEHEDGAITVEGSIVDEVQPWALERGIWRNA